MLNKRHCSPAKGLKGGRHCALSPVLIVVDDDDDDDDDAGDDYDDEEEEEEEEDVAESAERGGRRVVAENTYLLIRWREPFVLNKYATPETSPFATLSVPPRSLFIRATCLSDRGNVYRLE